jgi:hypothetical protein
MLELEIDQFGCAVAAVIRTGCYPQSEAIFSSEVLQTTVGATERHRLASGWSHFE